jgi:DNA-binding MarR family transcriptional regulator
MSEANSIDVTLFRALHLATRQVTAAVEQELQVSAGVSLPDFEILSALARSRGRRARPREIGDMLGWEKSRTSHQVTRMVKRGLLERVSCEVDMRGTWVTLTSAGARAVNAAESAYVSAIETHLGAVVSHEQKQHLAHQLLHISREANASTCQAEVAALESTLDR